MCFVVLTVLCAVSVLVMIDFGNEFVEYIVSVPDAAVVCCETFIFER
jgi:hypothetical protein